MRTLINIWRRRHAPRRLALQRQILDGETMTGIDVGAAEGLQPHWWAFEGIVDFQLFEPHAESAIRLEKMLSSSPHRAMFHVLPFALGGSSGERDFHILNARTGSSLYPIDLDSEFAGPDNSYIYPVRTERVSVRRLEEVLDEVGLPVIDVAKLDVQGAELEILEGLDEKRFANLILVETEVNLAGGVTRNRSPYIGAPTWADLDGYMVSRGMRLLDIGVSRAYRAKSGDPAWYQRAVFNVSDSSPSLAACAWEADAVYVRDHVDLIERGDCGALRKLVVVLGVYRFFSEAYAIVEQAEAAGVLSAQEAVGIKRCVVEWHSLVARRFWHGRGRIWSMARSLATRLGISQYRRWKQYMWYDYPSG